MKHYEFEQSATPRKLAAATGTVAVGSIVNTLPTGCAPETGGGIDYRRCGSVYYRVAFQGNNLVYMGQQP